MQRFTPAALRGLLVGLALVVVSLPRLWALHGALGLGKPPAEGLLLLGGAVMLSLALSGAAGAFIGRTHGNATLAALAGLAIALSACFVAAPFYGALVMDDVDRDATEMVVREGGRLTEGAQSAVENGALTRAQGTLEAARQGRMREEMARLQAQAKAATSPQARGRAANAAQDLADQLAPKGVELFKSGVARLSAFALLLWAIGAAPIGAAWECRRARR